ncbi:MAG: peptidoglycan-binding protein [Oscillatoria sp. PMC 1068.18]|nr:peptidoglycan-binding protein [Oscillatoria sp. PMC 1076.18]MEC4991302.1 peptidoglycan-binding protein [Oscillatoria sp. PMC 1068.18]
METLAYLHLALAYETETETIPNGVVNNYSLEKTFSEIIDIRIFNKGKVYLLSLIVALGILGTASEALALLTEGNRGAEVTAVQVRLQELGYFQARATGYFGEITKDAVMRFQKDRGLTPDGIVGPQTELALGKTTTQAVAPSPPNAVQILKIGDRGTQIQTLQQKLAQAKFYDGEINGIFDTQTEAAVRRFQQAQGLTVDGLVGPRTIAALPQLAVGGENNRTAQTSPASQPTILRPGTQGTLVAEVQRNLQSLGYFPGQISGKFDSDTQQAVTRFQQDRGLRPDGIVGNNTFLALRNPFPETNVKELQTRLKNAGFYQGQVDGIWGPQTQQAIEKAHKAYGISSQDLVNGNY